MAYFYRLSTFTIAFLFSSALLQAQGIEFFHGSWEEAKALAKKEGKPIFVDAYAEWCGPCKRMAAQVFTLPEVGEYYNTHFINMKIDMEKGPGREFGQTYPVRAYPTLFYIDFKGDVLKKSVGGKQGPDLIQMGTEVMAGFDTSGEFAKAYASGDRSYALVLEYIKALNKAKKPSLKISNEFLRQNPELSDEQKSVFIYEALTDADSRLFDLFISNKDMIEKTMGKQAVDQRIEAACKRTIDTAVEFESPNLLAEVQTKLITNLGNNGRSIAIEAEYTFAKATIDMQRLLTAAKDMARTLYTNDAAMLSEICVELKHYAGVDARMYGAIEEIGKMLLENSEDPRHYMIIADAMAAQNKKKEATKTAEKALKLAKQQKLDPTEIEEFIAAIKK